GRFGRSSFSNRDLQSRHAYSKIGIGCPFQPYHPGVNYQWRPSMNKLRWIAAISAFLLVFGVLLEADGGKITGLITGKSAFTDAKDLKPGLFRKITASDLPKPRETPSASNTKVAPHPDGALPQAPAGFKVEMYLGDMKSPRQIRM